MKEDSGILIKEMSSNGVLRLTMNNLDHKNALKNYVSRGMKIFKTKLLNIN